MQRDRELAGLLLAPEGRWLVPEAAEAAQGALRAALLHHPDRSTRHARAKRRVSVGQEEGAQPFPAAVRKAGLSDLTCLRRPRAFRSQGYDGLFSVESDHRIGLHAEDITFAWCRLDRVVVFTARGRPCARPPLSAPAPSPLAFFQPSEAPRPVPSLAGTLARRSLCFPTSPHPLPPPRSPTRSIGWCYPSPLPASRSQVHHAVDVPSHPACDSRLHEHCRGRRRQRRRRRSCGRRQ